MPDGELIGVEVAYALPERQSILKLDVAADTCVREVIEQSGICEQFPDIDLAHIRVGIWSKACTLDDRVKHGDRVEIYRALIADPKEARRRRAQKKEAESAQPD